MSEMVESPAPDSAPSTTSEVAERVIADFEAQDTESTTLVAPDPAKETALEAETPIEPVKAPEPAKELSEAAKFLIAQGHKLKKDDGRDVWLPAKTVEGMLERYAGQHKTGWDGARTQLERERDEARGYLENLKREVSGDARAYLEDLASVFPQYKQFLQPQAPAAPPAPPVSAQMPEPDLTLSDGSRTYSLDGLKTLLEWNTAQVESRLLPKVDERLKPWQEREEKAKTEAAQGQLRERHDQQMREAQSWPGFGQLPAPGQPLSDFQTEVLGELQKDTDAARAAGRRPSMTLRQAYLEVHARTLEKRANDARGVALKELNAAPKSTAVGRTGQETPRVTTGVSTRDIAERNLARLERGA